MFNRTRLNYFSNNVFSCDVSFFNFTEKSSNMTILLNNKSLLDTPSSRIPISLIPTTITNFNPVQGYNFLHDLLVLKTNNIYSALNYYIKIGFYTFNSSLISENQISLERKVFLPSNKTYNVSISFNTYEWISSNLTYSIISNCIDGKLCQGTQSINCPKGSFCIQNRTILCNPGTYQSNEGLSTCIPCPIGSFCSAEGNVIPGKCPVGYLCSKSKKYTKNS